MLKASYRQHTTKLASSYSSSPSIPLQSRFIPVSTTAATTSSSVSLLLVAPIAKSSFRFSSSSSSSSSSLSTSAAAAAASSIPSSSTAASSGSEKPSFTDEEIQSVVRALEADPDLAVRVVAKMSPAARRQLVVAGSAFEWFGGNRAAAQSEVSAADLDKDHVISAKDFDSWFEKALERRHRKQTGTGDDSSVSSSSGGAAATPLKKLTVGALVLLGLEAGLPFVGFGFLDNAAMILAGDVIDRAVGYYFCLSTMACAALGNVVSGMLGMQVHGSIERLVHFLKLPVPILTDEQRKSRKVFLAGHIGGTVGIAIGLCLGMLPLLFLSDHDEKAEVRAFNEIDANLDGRLSKHELQTALRVAGLDIVVSDEIAEKLVHKYGNGSHLNHDQFHRLAAELKHKGAAALVFASA